MSELLWGTYGKYGECRLTWKPLKDLSTDHLVAIMATQGRIPDEYRTAIGKIMEGRGYTWLAGKRKWDLSELHPLFHAKPYQVHHKFPGSMTSEEIEAEAEAKIHFVAALKQYIGFPKTADPFNYGY